MVNKDQVSGVAKQVKGSVKEAIGHRRQGHAGRRHGRQGCRQGAEDLWRRQAEDQGFPLILPKGSRKSGAAAEPPFSMAGLPPLKPAGRG